MWDLRLRGSGGRGVAGAEHLPESTRSRNLPGRLRRFLKAGTLSPEEGYLSWISFPEVGSPSLAGLSRSSAEAGTAHALPASALDGLGPYGLHLAFLRDGPATEMLDKALYLDMKTYLSDDLLMMGDKMSLASSLELRVPLYDHLLLEFIASIPPHLRIKGWRLKSLPKETVPPPAGARPDAGGDAAPGDGAIRRYLGADGRLQTGLSAHDLHPLDGGRHHADLHAACLVGVLIFDMIYITLARVASGKVSTFKEWIEFTGKDHLHRRLETLGLSRKQAVLLIYLLSIALGLGALVVMKGSTTDALLLLLQAAVLLSILSILMIMKANHTRGSE